MTLHPHYHPATRAEFRERDALLADALRSDAPALAHGAKFPIAAEYPLVLAADAARFSYCFRVGEDLAAHVNLWPRKLIDTARGRTWSLGLVGNVATAERFRGQGIMSRVFESLKEEARRQGLAALVLWSDLLEFYQKQGFQSFGKELRYRFAAQTLRQAGIPSNDLKQLSAPSERDLAAMFAQRFPIAITLERSPQDFKALASIPAMTILKGPTSYALVGKGADMVGVIHEWGAENPRALLSAAASAAQATGFPEIMVLAPGILPPPWHSELADHCIDVTEHPIGLSCPLSPEIPPILSSCFIWGLDSI